MVISKSEFMMFLRHPAWLWLKKYDKSKIPLPDEDLQARFDEGVLFEEYAEKLFPQAVKLGYQSNGQFSATKYYALPDDTKNELDNAVKTLFQGRVEVSVLGNNAITAIFDVLERVKDKKFNLYEIKSSTSVKQEHIYDLAFQTIVLEKYGLSINNIYVIHVNNKYVRQGSIDPKDITKTTDITSDVREALEDTKEKIKQAFKMLSSKNMPSLSPRYLVGGNLEEWLPIMEAVQGKIPEYSIYNLCFPKPEIIGLLEDKGIKDIKDVPLDIGLSEKQLRQVIATKEDKQDVDIEALKEFLDKLEYPLHFFDFETLSGVIPAFDGIKPYQQVPFQYSLHILEDEGGKLRHKDYIHTKKTNPVPALLESMKESFEDKGSVVSWYMSFEKSRNTEMGKMYPEYKNFLEEINDRMIDLMEPFSKGFFVDKRFFGSASIKKVLPALVPELSYKELEVSHGGQAQRVWMQTVLEGMNQDKKAHIMEDLRKYCSLDTYAMYAIYKYLLGKVS